MKIVDKREECQIDFTSSASEPKNIMQAPKQISFHYKADNEGKCTISVSLKAGYATWQETSLQGMTVVVFNVGKS